VPYPKDQKDKSKLRILDASIELFSRYGFDKVSIGEIMRKAKMTHGAFYAHFDSKEALFNASFMETVKRSRAARLIKGPLSVKHLTNLVTHYWNLRELAKRSDPGPEVILFNEAGTKNEKVKELFEESYNHLKKILENRLIALGKLKQIPLHPDREIAAAGHFIAPGRSRRCCEINFRAGRTAKNSGIRPAPNPLSAGCCYALT
jgi:TetR/AcrR family transcriptional repressor of nem operon